MVADVFVEIVFVGLGDVPYDLLVGDLCQYLQEVLFEDEIL